MWLWSILILICLVLGQGPAAKVNGQQQHQQRTEWRGPGHLKYPWESVIPDGGRVVEVLGAAPLYDYKAGALKKARLKFSQPAASTSKDLEILQHQYEAALTECEQAYGRNDVRLAPRLNRAL